MAGNPFIDPRNPPVSPLNRPETPEERRRRLAQLVLAEQNKGVVLDVPQTAANIFQGIKDVGSGLAPYAKLASPLAWADMALGAAAKPLGFAKPTAEEAAARVIPPAVAGASGRPGAPAAAGPATTYAPSDYFKHILKLEGGMARDGSFMRSPAGAWGPAQLMPGTAPEAMKLAGFRADDQRWKTDPEINKRAGEAYYNKQLKDFGNPAVAAAAYNAGPGATRKALAQAERTGQPWTAFLPAETRKYVKNFTKRAQGLPDFQNPFNPGNFAPVFGAIDQAEQQALQGGTFSTEMPQGPEFPGLPEMPKRDWTETDQLLEAAKPLALMEADQKRIKRANLLNGIAQGLASIPEGAGLGAVLAKVGAGALAGRAAGMEEVQKRSEAFEEKMAQYRLLQLKYGDEKAAGKYNEAVNEVQMLYNHNVKKTMYEAQQFAKDNNVSYQDGYYVVQRRNGENIDIQTVANAPAIRARFAGLRVNAASQFASAAQSGDNMEAAMTNQWIMGAALSERQEALAGEGPGRSPAERALQNTSMTIAEIIQNGTAAEVFTPEAYQTYGKKAMETLKVRGLLPGVDGYDEAMMDTLTGLITVDAMQNKQMQQRISQVAPAAWATMQSRRLREGKRTERTDAKGRTSITEQY